MFFVMGFLFRFSVYVFWYFKIQNLVSLPLIEKKVKRKEKKKIFFFNFWVKLEILKELRKRRRKIK